MTDIDISLDTPRVGGYPVVKRTAIDQRYLGVVAHKLQRDQRKKHPVTGVIGPVPHKTQPGKYRQELVLTCITLPGSNAPAGLGDDTKIAEPGEVVRVILKGLAFSQWIEQTKALGGLKVGDVFEQITTTAQAYDADGNPKGPEITTQAQADAVPRSTTLGYYGPLTVRRPGAAELPFKPAAAALYHEIEAAKTPDVALDDPHPETF